MNKLQKDYRLNSTFRSEPWGSYVFVVAFDFCDYFYIISFATNIIAIDNSPNLLRNLFAGLLNHGQSL